MNLSPDISWKIAAEPAALTHDEFWARYEHINMPEKFEAFHGKLFWSDEQRLHVLALLLEAIGLKKALRLCPPETVGAGRSKTRNLKSRIENAYDPPLSRLQTNPATGAGRLG